MALYRMGTYGLHLQLRGRLVVMDENTISLSYGGDVVPLYPPFAEQIYDDDLEAMLCPDCFCLYGEDNILRCLSDSNTVVCRCGHVLCGCGEAIVAHALDTRIHEGRYYSIGCVPNNNATPVQGNPDNTVIDALNNWSEIARPDIIHPFVYRPDKIVWGGKLYEIPVYIKQELRREVRIGLYLRDGEVIGAVLLHPRLNRQFHHYHDGCWGSLKLSTDNIVAHLEEGLSTINLDSVATRRPPGMPTMDNLITNKGPEILQWNADPTARNVVLSRQRTLNLVVPNSVWVIGVGGIGWNLARQLLLVGVQALYVSDQDSVSYSNRNRIDTTSTRIGTNKAVTFSERFRSISTANITPIGGIPSDEVLTRDTYPIRAVPQQLDVIVDCTDNLEAQRRHYAMVRWLFPDSRYVRVGYDGGWHVTVTGRQPAWLDLNPEATYAVPSWIGTADIAASLGVTKIVYDPQFEFSGDIREVLGVAIR